MDNIIFSLTRASDAITDKTLYRASVQTNGTYTLVVACRNGMRESLKPATAKVKNIVVKAA